MSRWTQSSSQTTVWNITAESYHSAPYSCTDSPNSDYAHYPNFLSNSIITPNISLTGYTNPKLSFWTKFEISPLVDFGRVQISSDGGSTWTSLSGSHTRTGTLLTSNSPTSIYTGAQDVWIKEEIDLSSYSNQQIKLKFLLNSLLTDPTAGPQYLWLERDGWYIDDIKVFEYNAILSDIFSPNSVWSNADGNDVKFSSNGSDNLYSTSDRPEFSFKRTTDNTAGISSYEILIQPIGKDYYPYISNIENKSDGEIVDTDTKYVKYSRDDIFAYSKKETDHLNKGAYKWKVRAIDNNGNSTDSDPKILRINTYEANFSGEWFPLVLLSKKINNYSPAFFGISTVGSTVTVKITQNGKSVAEKQAIVDSSSRFTITFLEKLPIGTYKINIFSTNKNNDYIEIPEFDLKVSRIAKTTNSILDLQSSSKSNVNEGIIPTQLPIPNENTTKTKHCFLWWCW